MNAAFIEGPPFSENFVSLMDFALPSLSIYEFKKKSILFTTENERGRNAVPKYQRREMCK
jgi:hypothetical protein